MPKSAKKEVKNNKLFLVIGAIISLFFIIVGIAMAIDSAGRDINGTVSGVLYAIAGIVILPQIKLKGWIKGVVFLLLVIIAELI